MRGLLIDSFNRTIGPIFLTDTDVHLFYKEVNQALKCKSHIYSTSKDESYQLIAEEDCLLNKDNIAFLSSFMPRPLFGNVILMGETQPLAIRLICPTIFMYYPYS